MSSVKQSPINFVCWKWEPRNGLHPKKKIKFTAEHVNRLYSMLKRNLRRPFKLHCITDDASDIRSEVNVIPLWPTYRELGGCYVRLPIFGRMASDLIGEDFFSIDLDVVILKDITDLVETTRQQCDFKMWADTNPTTPYNGSFFYMKSGAKRQVIDQFDPVQSPRKARMCGYVGTDQAWIGVCLGPNEAKWGTRDGVFSFRVHFMEGRRPNLMGSERIIFFHGASDPSKPETQQLAPWVTDHWK